jgi:hypothetical protein
MDNLDFMREEIGEHEPSFVEHVPDRPELDWKRLKDFNDDYDEILVTPNGKC